MSGNKLLQLIFVRASHQLLSHSIAQKVAYLEAFNKISRVSAWKGSNSRRQIYAREIFISPKLPLTKCDENNERAAIINYRDN